jgi:hypothetical protein
MRVRTLEVKARQPCQELRSEDKCPQFAISHTNKQQLRRTKWQSQMVGHPLRDLFPPTILPTFLIRYVCSRRRKQGHVPTNRSLSVFCLVFAPLIHTATPPAPQYPHRTADYTQPSNRTSVEYPLRVQTMAPLDRALDGPRRRVQPPLAP